MRNDVTDSGLLRETNIRIIKKCLFFLTYFTRSLQDTMAIRLIKQVFQPNERLTTVGKTLSMQIIDEGRADLQIARIHFNKPIFKTLRTIDRQSREARLSVSPNLFGFTSVVLRKPVSLTALSREFTVTYELQQKDFDELLIQYPADFESIC